MPKHKKTKRLSIERVVETESPDVTRETSNNTSNDTKKDDKEKSTCCNCFKFFSIEKPTTINGNNNVIDTNKEATISVGLNKK